MQVIRGREYFSVPDFENFRQIFYRTVLRYPKATFYMGKRSPKAEIEELSYLEAAGHVEALGQALLALSCKGARIGIIGNNSYCWCVSHLCNLLGLGTSVPLDKLLPENELCDLLKRARPKVLFHDKSFEDIVQRLLADKEYDFITYFVEMDEAFALPAVCPSGKDLVGKLKKLQKIHKKARPRRKMLSLTDFLPSDIKKGEAEELNVEELRSFIDKQDRQLKYSWLLGYGNKLVEEGKVDFIDLEIDRNSVASLIFTSGTTALSKAVMLSHANLTSEVTGLARMVYWKPGTRSLSVLPLHHTFENTAGLLMIVFYGGTVCSCNGLRYIQKNMEELKVNLLIGVPLLFENFYKKIQASIRKNGKEESLQKGLSLSKSLCKLGINAKRRIFKDIHKAFGGKFKYGICGASSLDREVMEFFNNIGVQLLQGYGLTETSPVASGCNHKYLIPGSVGHPIHGVEIAIDCEEDGAEGEILIRGPIVMLGYMAPDGSVDRSSIDEDGWFHTGDVGRIKGDCLYITGRLKSMIVLPNGKKVFPEELEDLINRSPHVKECMVWGEDIGDDVFVSAKLVLDPNDYKNEKGEILPPDTIIERLDALISEVNKRMPNFKYIKYYVYSFQDMVKTTTQKVKRNVEQANMKGLFEKFNLSLKDYNKSNVDELQEDGSKAQAGLNEGKGQGQENEDELTR